MKKFSSISKNHKLTPDEIADMCVSYSNGIGHKDLAEKYKLYQDTVKAIIFRHYIGIVPKNRQKTITIPSKINEL